MRAVWLCLLLSGCTPFLELRGAVQVDPWSDWVLQPERPWTSDEPRLHLITGFSKGQYDCPYIDVLLAGPHEQFFVGCARNWGQGRWYASAQLMHQVDERTEAFLRTDQKQWQGHNPFFHLRLGMQWLDGRLKCPGIASGKSLFQGAPFEEEDGNPDLYWTNLECSLRWPAPTR